MITVLSGGKFLSMPPKIAARLRSCWRIPFADTTLSESKKNKALTAMTNNAVIRYILGVAPQGRPLTLLISASTYLTDGSKSTKRAGRKKTLYPAWSGFMKMKIWKRKPGANHSPKNKIFFVEVRRQPPLRIRA